MSTRLWNVSKGGEGEGGSTSSLGFLCQWLVPLTVKRHFLSSEGTFCHVTEHPLFTYLYTLITSPWAFLCWRVSALSPPHMRDDKCCFHTEISPLIIFMALPWIVSSLSMSVAYWGAQTWTPILTDTGLQPDFVLLITTLYSASFQPTLLGSFSPYVNSFSRRILVETVSKGFLKVLEDSSFLSMYVYLQFPVCWTSHFSILKLSGEFAFVNGTCEGLWCLTVAESTSSRWGEAFPKLIDSTFPWISLSFGSEPLWIDERRLLNPEECQCLKLCKFSLIFHHWALPLAKLLKPYSHAPEILWVINNNEMIVI